jgi:hypothetical protein
MPPPPVVPDPAAAEGKRLNKSVVETPHPTVAAIAAIAVAAASAVVVVNGVAVVTIA